MPIPRSAPAPGSKWFAGLVAVGLVAFGCGGRTAETPDVGGQPDSGGALADAGARDRGPVMPDVGVDAGSDASVDAGPDAHVDAGPGDAMAQDAEPDDLGREDAGAADAVVHDVGPADLGVLDVGPPDVGPPDAGASDAGPPDLGPPDSGPVDIGVSDAHLPDVGHPDATAPDAGPVDVGPVDAGPPDAGFYRITAVGEWGWLEANDFGTGRTMNFTTCPAGGCCAIDVPAGWNLYASAGRNSLCVNYSAYVATPSGGAGVSCYGFNPSFPNDPTTCVGYPTADALIVSSRYEPTSPSTCNPTFRPTTCSPRMCGYVAATNLSCPACPAGAYCASNFCVSCP